MNFKPGTRISVKPVVFYPHGVSLSREWTLRWKKFHDAAQVKYQSMLKGRDTFELSEIISMQGALPADAYTNLCFTFDGLKHPANLDEGEGCSRGVETMVSELLLNHPALNKFNRFTLPYCLSILFVDPNKDWVGGGGRNINGDLNLGGGILVIPTWQFDDGKLMSTLLHELGHAFGLPHSWQRPVSPRSLKQCYYLEKTSHSVMSYNEDNWTNNTDSDEIPGCLLGDDIHALAQNKWVFPNLFFNSNADFDCPPANAKCAPHPKKVHPLHLGPMHLFFCTTDFDSAYSSILTLNDTPGRWILSDHPAIGFDSQRMWHSAEANAEGWVSLEVTFPIPITLNRVIFYTQYGGDTHKAQVVQIEVADENGSFHFVKRVTAPDPDTEILFQSKKSNIWKFAFKAGTSKYVVVRGIRFFNFDDEIFPPLGPTATTAFGSSQGSKVSNLVEIQRVIRPNGGPATFDSRSMWMSDKANAEGWVSIEIIFPTEVNLDRLIIYSFSINKPELVQLEVSDDNGVYHFVKRSQISTVEPNFSFSKTKGKAWKLAFKGKENGFIIIRGLRFMIGNSEFYPPSKVE